MGKRGDPHKISTSQTIAESRAKMFRYVVFTVMLRTNGLSKHLHTRVG